MMNNVFILLVLVVGIGHSPTSSAWEACMPFCDLECSGAEMTNLAAQVVSDLNTVTTTCQSLISARNDMAQTISETFAEMSSEVAAYYMGILSGLDASVNQIAGGNEQQAVALANFVDVINSTIHETSKNTVKANEFFHNDYLYGIHSAPENQMIMQSACTDCTDEPVIEALSQIDSFAVDSYDFATIVQEGMVNQTGNRTQKEAVVSKLDTKDNLLAQLAPWESADEYAQYLSYQNIDRFADNDFDAVHAELLGSITGGYFNYYEFGDDEAYEALSTLGESTSGSIDSLVRGIESDALLQADYINDTAQLNAHGLRNRMVNAKQVETAQYNALYQLLTTENVIAALDIANEAFK
ncbi:hypothetical protein [Alteromonas stellipolaris]|uniref:Imelysin-like domain-containing protein n=1 Tax=Alteromonas stellipolaris TaxID=233316 RepID=A0ABM5YPT7_9ALTE|nr:hypothetical protein AVL57_00355 [Alteromonas stellipolaris]